MDERAPISELALRVASAKHRLPSGLGRFKGHRLLFSGPYSFAHFGMGEGAATGGEEPAVLPILTGTGLKGSHFRFECVLVENVIFVVVVLLQ